QRRCGMNAAMEDHVVTAHNLRKAYRNTVALDNASFDVGSGRIIGLIGPNGAGKTTALKAMLGLTPFDGDLKVLGRDPRTQRDELMNDVCFIADVAVLPRWIRVKEAIDLVAGVHPRFDRDRCERSVADVAVLPRCIRVNEAIDFVAGAHPPFDRDRCERFLANAQLKPRQRVRELSKGMIVQLHVALVMAIDARLLVLDEPTLGLDIL